MCCQLLSNKLNASIAWFKTLLNAFGVEFLLALVVIQHILKGLVAGGGGAGLVGTSVPFVFKELGITASELSTYKAIAMTPWSIKPIMGFCSDLIPLCGYHKRYYFAASTVVSLVRGYPDVVLLL